MAWISVSEARRRLDNAVSVGTIYRLVRAGHLVGTQIAGKVLVDHLSLDALINRGKLRAMSPRARGKGP